MGSSQTMLFHRPSGSWPESASQALGLLDLVTFIDTNRALLTHRDFSAKGIVFRAADDTYSDGAFHRSRMASTP